MSPNPYPVFQVVEGLSVDELRQRIRLLIRLYAFDKNIAVAQAVEEHINGLLAHEDYKADVSQRCQLRRLSVHWRYLAWVS